MASHITFLSTFRLLLLLLIPTPSAASARDTDLQSLLTCLGDAGITNFTRFSSSPASQYSSVLGFSARNLRFVSSKLAKPAVIVVPQTTAHVQHSLVCCVEAGFEIRVRSGGHSVEGLSYVGDVPRFVLIDLINLDAITIHPSTNTAIVQSGASIGQLYVAISQISPRLSFPAGTFPTIGLGGHLSGGGMGDLTRKFGLAADHVIDVSFVNFEGHLLRRSELGEDAFWALRGGGGGSWGVVVDWTIQLLPIPPRITFFSLTRMGFSEAVDLVYKWQTFWHSPNVTDDFFLYVTVFTIRNGKVKNIAVGFQGIFLGPVSETFTLVNAIFPELGLTIKDCQHVTWIEAFRLQANYLGNFYNDVQSLTNKSTPFRFQQALKVKSDFATTPLPKSVLKKAFHVIEQDPGEGSMNLLPFGGAMTRIPSDAIAFPHRAAILYYISYYAIWSNLSDTEANMRWVRRLHSTMTPHVSKSPRRAYVNELDLDIGSTMNGTSTLAQAAQWGKPYFVGNFEKLAEIKCKVDPFNVFQNPQSIPPACKSEATLHRCSP